MIIMRCKNQTSFDKWVVLTDTCKLVMAIRTIRNELM